MENLENLEKLEKVENLLEQEQEEKKKIELEEKRENLVEKINTQLKECSIEKGLYWYSYSKNNKTLHFNKASMENLQEYGFILPEKVASRKYINYVQNPSTFNIVEKLFSLYNTSFQLKEELEKVEK